jgi:hypothetical protein
MYDSPDTHASVAVANHISKVAIPQYLGRLSNQIRRHVTAIPVISEGPPESI